MKGGIGLVALAALTACASNQNIAESLRAQHLHAVSHPRPIDLAVGAAMAKAEAICGGPVVLVVEGDPADFGWDPSHYQCKTPRPR